MRLGALLPAAAMIVTAHAAAADDKPLIVYVSPNPIGVNDFLKLGKAGTEKIADQLGAAAKVMACPMGQPTKSTAVQPIDHQAGP